MSAKKIVIIDYHPIIRKGLSELITSAGGFTVCAQFATAYEAKDRIKELAPDLIIIDISLKGGCGIDFIKDIKQFYPDTLVLVFSSNHEVIFTDHVLRAGASGYLIKEDSLENLLNGIRQVLSGEIYVSEKIRLKLLKHLVTKPNKSKKSPIELLSSRELEVFQLIGEGLSTKIIADQLSLGIKTIETYRFHIKRKLDIKDNTKLIQQAVRWLNGLEK